MKLSALALSVSLERAHVLDRLVRALGLPVEHPDAVEQLVVVRRLLEQRLVGLGAFEIAVFARSVAL
jgi:hypothetical protein